MTFNNSFLNRIPNTLLLLILVIVLSVKLFLYALLKADVISIGIGGGNDSDYYNDYALGYTNYAVNSWPELLRYLEQNGLYSREGVSFFLLTLNLLFIPLVACKLAGLKFNKDQKYYLYLLLLCTIYPSLYFYTLDIYRDIFMVSVFLTGCLLVKKSLYSRNIVAFLFFSIISVLIGLYLVSMRKYLGYAFLISMVLWKFELTQKRFFILSLLYTVLLFSLHALGLFDQIVEYRTGFENTTGSTLGLDFSNPLFFIPNLALSTLGQLFGLYITNSLAVALLIIETIPFFFMLLFIIKNIKLADKFLRFMISFFIIYTSIWLIGNDNLGTAIRLRFYDYLIVYICFFYILKIKKYHQV